jgi:4-hydroxythreonine-4-phosphate dehydrogenase
MAFKSRLLISTGDVDGVGWEVTAKALAAIGPKSRVQFFYFRDPSGKDPQTKTLKKNHARKFTVHSVSSLDEALAQPFQPKRLVEILSHDSPAQWVEEAARSCLRGDIQALVTAPLSKTTIIQSGRKDIGHTEILMRITSCKDVFMGFQGRNFSVVLASGHVSTTRAILDLTPKRLEAAIQAAHQLRALLPAAKKRLPLALVGVNPHAGEEGLIGTEEQWMKEVLKKHRSKPGIRGPLVPDVAYQPRFWKEHSVYIAPYHDQGLIPFKLVHGFETGVHITLGIPMVRTSVDHGCAKDIFGQNKAEHGSMKDAILTAIRLAKLGDPA